LLVLDWQNGLQEHSSVLILLEGAGHLSEMAKLLQMSKPAKLF